MSEVLVREVAATEVIAVRWPVLRPGYPRDSAIFAGDDAPETRHFGTFADGVLASVASIYRAPLPECPNVAEAWQLRGMATLPEYRGRGFGRLILVACENASRAGGAELIWCNARVSAAAFYARHGWQILGGEFDIPTVGPHFRMWRSL
jgi:GNAT superfamily N-acetyltransferase